MAAIRAGILNQGLGNFHGRGYHRNANYNRYQEDNDKIETISDSDSDDSSVNSNGKGQSTYMLNMLAIEKHQICMARKHESIEKTEKILKYIDSSIFILGLTGVITAHIESEMFYDNGNSPTESSNGLRSIVTISTIILLFLIMAHAKLDHQILVHKREAPEEDVEEFFLSSHFKVLLLELFANSIHCPPGVNHEFVSTQLGGTLTISINELCACAMLVRVYLILKLFRHFTKWTSPKAKDFCRQFGIEPSPLFAVKAMLKEKPFHLLVPLILLSILVFSLSVRIFERGFLSESSQQDYSYIWNSMWLVMLTMTTVGYGDFFPRTHFGRFIIVLACLWGIFLISLMIVTLTNFILFKNEESRSFDYMKKVEAMDRSKKFARLYIRAQLRRYLYYRNHRKDATSFKDTKELPLLIKFYFKKYKDYQNEARFGDIGAAEMLTVLNERISMQVRYITRHLNYAHSVHDNLALAVSSQEKTKGNLFSSIKYLQKLKRRFIS